MPKIEEERPEKIRPYEFHGVHLEWSEGKKEAVGTCPFCGRENRFTVDVKTGQWRCFSCAEGTTSGGGNIYTFLRKLVEFNTATPEDYQELATDRGLLDSDTLIQWGVFKSPITEEWLVPGYGIDGKIHQLYRYVFINGKRRLLATPTLKHQLHGIQKPKAEIVYLCEGPWDGMALWELFRRTKVVDDGLALTSHERRSVLANTCVLAVPGCNVFDEKWTSLFSSKQVHLLYDSDHPPTQKKTGKLLDPPGFAGMRRTTGILANVKMPPLEISYLNWGEEGYDPDLPSGTDVRDILGGADTYAGRISKLELLIERFEPVPETWAEEAAKAKEGIPDLSCEECDNYATVIAAWKRAMNWTDGLDCALSVMLASVASTPGIGDQLWVKIIGPPACGKSTLCEAVSVNRQFVLAKSTIRGFHSGFTKDNANGVAQDHGLAVLARGKTLVTKDGDTLLQSPNLPQILAEARDIYDGTARTHYRNAVANEYEGLKMTWILCGTSSLRMLDSSELGERFLDCVIMETIDRDLEEDISWNVIQRTVRNLGVEAEAIKQYDPDMRIAMQLTGGYVQWLRENVVDVCSGLTFPEEAMRQCVTLAKFVSNLRARPSFRHEEQVERELSSRLTAQLGRLAGCMAFVLNRKEVDSEVMRRVKKVALDTARGRTMQILQLLYKEEKGVEQGSIYNLINHGQDKTRFLTRFMKAIGLVELHTPKIKGVVGRPRLRLTEYARNLYHDVMEG